MVVRWKLCSGNLIRAIKAWAIGEVRYSAGIFELEYRNQELTDVKTRKRLTMFGVLHKKGTRAEPL